MTIAKRFPHFKQQQSRECGALCLRMIAKYFGRLYSTETLLDLSRQKNEGATLLGLSEAAEAIGMHTIAAKISFNRLIDDIPLPGIAHWKENHFVVVVDANPYEVVIADPAYDAVVTIPREVFLEGWVGDSKGVEAEGVILLMEPTPEFHNIGIPAAPQTGFRYIWDYFSKYKTTLLIQFAGLVIGLFLMAVFPFIVQALVDKSIESKNPELLYIFLIAWILLYLCKVLLDMARGFLTYHLGSKVNIRISTAFMLKVIRLPLPYFKSRVLDDIMHLFIENNRIQHFLAVELFAMIYASSLLVVLSLVLAFFSIPIFLVFVAFMILQGLTTFYFLRRRKEISYERHKYAAARYNKLLDIIRGIADIRLNNAAQAKRWSWEKSEAELHYINKKIFNTGEFLRQIPFYLGDLRNIIIIFLSALTVISGQMTIGILVAVVFILMQANQPFKQVVDFLLGYQETRQVLERMEEIKHKHSRESEESLDSLPDNADIIIENVSFRYEGEHSPWAIKNLSLKIPFAKTSVIAGPNGSGKTTLLNLILKTYTPEAGTIKFGNFPLNEIPEDELLEKCGVVQQEGYIFYDTIARNIALGTGTTDSKRLYEAARMANLLPFLERLKNGFRTIVGEGGIGLSKGQKQCILIARALYRNPEYLFLDEATNDLDAETERIILENIKSAFRGKTVLIFANRIPVDFIADEIIPLAIPRQTLAATMETTTRRGTKNMKGQGNSDHQSSPV